MLLNFGHLRCLCLYFSTFFYCNLLSKVGRGRQSSTLLPHLMDFGGKGKGGSKATVKESRAWELELSKIFLSKHFF